MLVDFVLTQFVSSQDPEDEVLAFLQEDCELVPTTNGVRWAMLPTLRTRTLAESPVRQLRRARSSTEAESTILQKVLDRSLFEGFEDQELSLLTPEELRSLAVVADWWNGAIPSVPPPEEVRTLVERVNLFSDVRSMASDHFVGREDVLLELRDHFRSTQPTPYLLCGVGGIGKSALVARHLVSCLDVENSYAVLVDFDDPLLDAYNPMSVVSTIVTQLAAQSEGVSHRKLVRIEAAAYDELETADTRTKAPSRASSFDDSRWMPIIQDALKTLRRGRKLLVVFDTFEQVQRRGPVAVDAVSATVAELAAHGDQVRVVVSGRAEAPEIAPPRYLRELGMGEAVELMRRVAGEERLDVATATALVDHLGGSPLTVRLTAQLLRSSNHAGDLLAIEVRAAEVDAFLYDRVLGHLDKDVRALAHPGLVLRTITPEVILHVLAKPCGLRISSLEGATHLFRKLADEPMLVDLDREAGVLTHRADVRALMLPQLLRDPRVGHERVQRSAIRFYQGSQGGPEKVEELYHRLLLGQSEKTLDLHWDDGAARSLVPVMDEFPPRSRRHLATRVPDTYLPPEELQLADEASWVQQVRRQVLRLLSRQQHSEALQRLRERRGRDGRSLLPDLELESLEFLGRIDEAVAIAVEGRRDAALRGDVDGAITFGLHLARLLERQGRAEEGLEILEETLGTATPSPTLGRLRILVAWLGLTRRAGLGADLREQREDEAVALRGELGPAAVRAVPGLVRDLAAETGSRSSAVLLDALQTVGLDAREDGEVAHALEELSTEVSGPDEDAVSDLMEIEHDPGEDAAAHWRKVATKSRGETGRGISEVLTSFEPQTESLKKAVRREFQIESDAATFL